MQNLGGHCFVYFVAGSELSVLVFAHHEKSVVVVNEGDVAVANGAHDYSRGSTMCLNNGIF